jgi:O-antigen ligase
MMRLPSLDTFVTALISAGVFLLCAFALVVPSGYTLGALILLLPSLVYLFVRPWPVLQREDFYLMAALLVYFAVGASTNAHHHLKGSSYDNLSRFLLVIPVLLLLLRKAIKPAVVWQGIALGAMGAAVLALWEFVVWGEERASGHINAIQFGDIAMLFFCLLVAVVPWAKTGGRLFLLLVIAGAAGGLLASLLSGARGGWLMLPVASGLVYWWSGRRTKKANVIFVFVAILAIAALCWLPWFEFLRDRLSHIALDLQNYQDTRDVTSSLGSRLHLWQLSLDMIARHPLLGWGSFENYVAATGVQDDVLVRYNHMHNDLLDAWVKRGLIGVSALCTIYLVPGMVFYRQLRRHSGAGQSLAARSTALAGIMLVAATFVFGLTQTYLAHASGVTLYSFLLVILWSQVRHADRQPV